MSNIEKLYKNFGILADAKDKISEHEAEYLEILAAVKGSSNEKRLASQFIARFFKHFPKLADQAIDAQLDLCEDEDVAIRRQAIKDLPSLCKDDRNQLPKIADVLAQLLQTDDTNELSTVHNSMMTLFKIDAAGTLGGIFSQIVGGDDIVRERGIKFINSKIKVLQHDGLLDKNAEEILLTECKKALQDVTAEEFVLFMEILSTLKITKLVSGHQQIIEIASNQAELDKPFEHLNGESANRLLVCIKHAMPYFSPMVPSTRFVEYLCDKVFPVLGEVKGVDDGRDYQLEILKQLAELSKYIGDMENMEDRILTIFDKLLEFMPLPLTDAEDQSEEPKLEFSYVECVMYTFHHMARKYPEFLTGTDNADRLKDFRIRLQYFARGISGYIKKLRESLLGLKGDALKTDENKLKLIALRTTSNINTLIRDLFHNPPSYKSSVNLSWRPVTTQHQTSSPLAQSTTLAGQKRSDRTPITYDISPEKRSRFSSKQESYLPSSGNYRFKDRNFGSGTFMRGRGGRGGYGGYGRRGRGRGWY